MMHSACFKIIISHVQDSGNLQLSPMFVKKEVTAINRSDVTV